MIAIRAFSFKFSFTTRIAPRAAPGRDPAPSFGRRRRFHLSTSSLGHLAAVPLHRHWIFAFTQWPGVLQAPLPPFRTASVSPFIHSGIGQTEARVGDGGAPQGRSEASSS